MSEWRDIDSAPKDGSEILLYCPTSRVKVTGGYWDDTIRPVCFVAGGYMRATRPPTHWQPSPEPPQEHKQ